jgi:putative DNA primase/helicase
LWLELLREKHGNREAIGTSITTPETPRQIALLRQKLAFVDADCDYETYRNVIWGIASRGWECAYQIALEWSLTAEYRFEEHTLDALFYSYDPDRDDRVTVGTIYHYAKQGGA